METKVSSIIGINNSHIYHREQLKSAKYRTSHLNQYHRRFQECRTPHQGPNCFCTNWFNQSHYLEPWSLFLVVKNLENHEVYQENACQKEIWQQKFIKNKDFYCLEEV